MRNFPCDGGELDHRSKEKVSKDLESLLENMTLKEKSVILSVINRHTITKDINRSFDGNLTVAARLADKVAAFGGSWTFIILFSIILFLWIIMNMLWVSKAFDPYPFIFLNLVLSMLAAVQAPVIMMSQNRQSAKDRLNAEHDYEVNLKAEMGIMALHEKFDQLRANELKGLIEKQQEQIKILSNMVLSNKVAKL
ncbi:DUF1003 domain-containing protein [Ochrobactrum soli]